MRRKRCRCCRRFYQPEGQTYRQQKTCSKPACRAWRRKEALKTWRIKNPLYGERAGVKQKLWRGRHKDYWRQWRSLHPGYVQRNRKLQKIRDVKKRGFLAKRNEWKSLCTEKLTRIRSLRYLAKENEWNAIPLRQIDGICRYLEGHILLAK